MLALENITLQLGERDLLNGVNALINEGDHIGLVGPNGAGKSTLLKIIAGELECDEGGVQISGEESIGYLPQDGVDPDFSLSVYEEVESAFAHLLELEQKVNRLQHKLAETDAKSEAHEKLLEEYGKLQHKLELSGVYSLRSEIEKILMGLGFSESDFSRSTTEFSGGWLMRIALAKLLLKNPTYLLLDEPTNHLDIESLQWMEQFLENYKGAVIVVSHDRAFLDNMTNRTLALRQGQIRDYSGNYSFYENKWEEEKELLLNAQKNQEKQLKETQEFIDRFRYKATKARQVQSRIKQMEKVEKIEVEDDLTEVSFRFPEPERSGAVVMKLEDLSKSYGAYQVFDQLNFEMERGDKIAVLGPNGAGKSTLIRILAGMEPFHGGKRITGHNVTVSYFAQHQAQELDESLDVLNTLKTAGSNQGESQLRTLLGCFLFQGDDVFKKVKVLSGGEKSRLALSKMILSPSNLLIFDEPTNHLDMASKSRLQQALQQYEGSCIIVSHDRNFLDPIVNKVLEVQPRRVRTFLGNVSFYLSKKAEENEDADTASSMETDTSKTTRKEQRRKEAERRNERNRRINPVKKKMQAVEKEIAEFETKKEEIEMFMADPGFYEDPAHVKEQSMQYEEIKKKLADSYHKWEEYALRIEAIEEELNQ